MLSASNGASCLSGSHGGYGLLTSHSCYGNTNGGSAATGMYLGTPIVPPSLLYPQLYSGVSQSQLHPSIHLLSNELRSAVDTAQPQRIAGLNNMAASRANSGSVDGEIEPETRNSDNRQPHHVTSTASENTLFGITNGHSDPALWRPY
ncbi:uncharacterized protein LOC111088958 [Limulus polyphemus]|uniref:Uncharacterized protein LOC111088958 n=1 Tax=Limulus polyphemus TaxID=6850 RepID=A0ABM1TJQ7_LIMPO|nr:uncharacterized protein LOC111088958 [Limulus polyphemus]